MQPITTIYRAFVLSVTNCEIDRYKCPTNLEYVAAIDNPTSSKS